MSKQILLIVFTYIFLLPLNVFANYTGKQILKASQRYGMTDRELKYLLNNTDPDLTLKDNKFGATALIHSAINNRPNMVRLLLEEGGAEIDATDYNRETALMGASRHCHQEVIDILLEFGADKTQVGKFNKTAFDYAKQNCSSSFAENIGGPSGGKTSSISAVVKAKSLFKKKRGMDSDSDSDIDDWGDDDDWPELTPRGNKALQDIVKIKGILDYMDKYERSPGSGPGTVTEKISKKQKVSFQNMAKAIGTWPAIHKKQLARTAEEEKRKQEMKKKIQGSKKRAMSKLRTMGLLKKGGANYRARMDEIERKNKIDNLVNERVNEIIIANEKEKEKLLIEINKKKRRAINLIIFTGSKSKNLNNLKKEKEDVIIAKWRTIKDLLDSEERRIESSNKLKMARKKYQAIRHFRAGGKKLRDKMRALELEEKKANEKAARDAKLAEERRRKELERKLALEKKRLLDELNKKEKALQDALRREEERRLAEEKRKKDLERDGGMVIGGTHGDSDIVKIDEKNKTITTADFKINFLKNRNCQVRKRANGTYFLFVFTYKASDIKQSGRNRAIWFINKSGIPAPLNGGKSCSRRNCNDYAIFHAGGVRKDLFMSNLTLELGKGPKDHFEIYSSKAGNPTIKVSIKECRNFPKK